MRPQRFQKLSNQLLILDIIRAEGAVSQADLAVRTGLQPSTVSNLARDLKALGLIESTGKGDSGPEGGKRADLLSAAPGFGLFAGVVVKPESFSCTVRDFAGFETASSSRPLRQLDHLRIPEVIAREADGLSPKAGELSGIGVAVRSVVDPSGAIHRSTDFDWEVPGFAERLHDAMPGVEIVVENDANCAAYHAYVLLGHRFRDIVSFSIHVDPFMMGAGIIMDGTLYRGPSGAAGEIFERDVDTVKELNERLAEDPRSVRTKRTLRRVLAMAREAVVGSALLLDSPAVVLSGDFTALGKDVTDRFVGDLGRGLPGVSVTLFETPDFAGAGAAQLAADSAVRALLAGP